MKRLLILAVLFYSFSLSHAQLLWKITGNGLKTPSYLFGTHHLIPVVYLDSIKGLYSAFNTCDAVVGEIIINNSEASAMIQNAAMLPPGKTINDFLSGDKYKLVDKELKSMLKFGLKELSTMNPAMILNLYEMELYKHVSGVDDQSQSDSYFQQVAAQKDKKIFGLETAEKQIKLLFGDGNFQRQADILAETVMKKDSIGHEMINMNKLYKSGNLNALFELSKGKGSIVDMTTEEYTKLVDERNADWIRQLPEIMKNRSCFIAVGALHLPGNKGLIKKLQQLGYKVKPVE